jgi:hypothetical protein
MSSGLNSSSSTFQFIKKSWRPFLSKNVLLQKIGAKFYIEQDQDPHFFQGSDTVFFPKVGSGSGPKSSGSATLDKNFSVG